jgi:hypothetical protein
MVGETQNPDNLNSPGSVVQTFDFGLENILDHTVEVNFDLKVVPFIFVGRRFDFIGRLSDTGHKNLFLSVRSHVDVMFQDIG